MQTLCDYCGQSQQNYSGLMFNHHFIYGKGVASEEYQDWHVIASAPVKFAPLYRRIATYIINPVLATVQSSIAYDTQLLVCVEQGNEAYWTYSRVFHVGTDASGRKLFSYHTLLMSDERLTHIGYQPSRLLRLMAYKKGRHGFYIGGVDEEIAGENPIQLKTIELRADKLPDTIPDTINAHGDQDVTNAVQALDIKFVDAIPRSDGVTHDVLEFLTSTPESHLGVLAGVSLSEAKSAQSKLRSLGIGLVSRLSPDSAQSGAKAAEPIADSPLSTLAPTVDAPDGASKSKSVENNNKNVLSTPCQTTDDITLAEFEDTAEANRSDRTAKTNPERSPLLDGQPQPPHHSPHSPPQSQTISTANTATKAKNRIAWTALGFAFLAFLIVLLQKPVASDDARIPELQRDIRALQSEIETRQDKVSADAALHQLQVGLKEQLAELELMLNTTQTKTDNNLVVTEQLQEQLTQLSVRLDTSTRELSDLAGNIKGTQGTESDTPEIESE